MRKLLVLAAVIGTTAANAAFIEGFENGPTTFTNGTVSNWGNGGPTPMVFASGTWITYNVSNPLGPTGWFNDSSQFPPFAGSCMMNANYNNGLATGPIRNFLMSPMLKFTNANSITFWTRTVGNPIFPDRLRLRLSLSAGSTNPADFNIVLLDINPSLTTTGYPNAWTQFTINLVGIGAAIPSGRFAFEYINSSGGLGGADFIGIDDVAYN